ncbi:glycoside hydrolase superfamily [Aspergillus cavernicola]|uniref:Glycoside hydrolase superfamily n=1 Tax=Aspergillus cavernicola TaxID=176166 RepID=A0ABR4IVG1_9EURO
MIRNRAFQGSSINRAASLVRNMDHWNHVGEVSLSIDTASPSLSSGLPYQMRMDVPAGTTGPVGFYNEGFGGFNVNASQTYIARLYMRGDYSGDISCYFHRNTSDEVLNSATITVDQTSSDGWKQTYSPTFHPAQTASDANNTFYFTFDGEQLAGQSVYFNLLSEFKQTYKNRHNGVRFDMAEALDNLGANIVHLPGGNNMEGLYSPYYWKWNETTGSLVDRPGRPDTWGDINTDGFGLLEMMQMAKDLELEVILGVWGELYLNGEIVPEVDLQPYIDSVPDELEAIRPLSSEKNEQPLAFYDAIHAAYPSINLIPTINPNPISTPPSGSVDLHIYANEAHFTSLFSNFDQASRDYPVFVNEYAATNIDSNTNAEIGAQTFGSSASDYLCCLPNEHYAALPTFWEVMEARQTVRILASPDLLHVYCRCGCAIIINYKVDDDFGSYPTSSTDSLSDPFPYALESD